MWHCRPLYFNKFPLKKVDCRLRSIIYSNVAAGQPATRWPRGPTLTTFTSPLPPPHTWGPGSVNQHSSHMDGQTGQRSQFTCPVYIPAYLTNKASILWTAVRYCTCSYWYLYGVGWYGRVSTCTATIAYLLTRSMGIYIGRYQECPLESPSCAFATLHYQEELFAALQKKPAWLKRQTWGVSRTQELQHAHIHTYICTVCRMYLLHRAYIICNPGFPGEDSRSSIYVYTASVFSTLWIWSWILANFL